MAWKTNKYKAKITTRDGKKFASKLEADYYSKLKFWKKSGIVDFFLQQVPFHLPGNTKYVVDFQIFWSCGTVSFVDVKGVETAMFKLKKKQVEDLYPVEIEVVKSV